MSPPGLRRVLAPAPALPAGEIMAAPGARPRRRQHHDHDQDHETSAMPGRRRGHHDRRRRRRRRPGRRCRSARAHRRRSTGERSRSRVVFRALPTEFAAHETFALPASLLTQKKVRRDDGTTDDVRGRWTREEIEFHIRVTLGDAAVWRERLAYLSAYEGACEAAERAAGLPAMHTAWDAAVARQIGSERVSGPPRRGPTLACSPSCRWRSATSRRGPRRRPTPIAA